MEAFQIRPNPIYRGSRPIRSAKYLRFVRGFACVGCGKTRTIEAMHTGPHGMGQKSSDTSALPGCVWCHRELHTLGPVGFQERYNLDFAALIAEFNALYLAKWSF